MTFIQDLLINLPTSGYLNYFFPLKKLGVALNVYGNI